MELLPNALAVLEKRYFMRNETGVPVEDAEGMFRRVANAVSRGDPVLAEKFYTLMAELDFLPNSPTLMNAGRPMGQLSACFVLPVEDDLGGIFDAVKQAAMIHKSGGGTGFSFSRLRPAESIVSSTGGMASGPVCFMRVFNAATEAVKQGGTRRGANMGVLRVDHPDIEEFIRCKNQPGDLTNFNISVGLTDAFLDAVERDSYYELINPRDKQPTGTLNAREVYGDIVDSAWKNGEPGVLFLDRINAANPVPAQGEIEATNPCGEQPLLPFESCNLGSVNLKNMVSGGGVEWDRLKSTVELAVLFLDNVIDINAYPLRKIEETTLLTRKIGLGVMGFADMLLLLGLPYNSEEAVKLGGEVMAFIDGAAKAASEKLAVERGVFPLFGKSVLDRPRRNAAVTTIAPTGTLSLIAGVSSGIEPVFAYSYTRHVMDGAELVEVNPILRGALESHGAKTLDELPEEIRAVFVSAHDVSPEWHIRMQAAFQAHVDNAVSKTVNFPCDATVEQVREVYDLAYRLGCKGVTIYRDGSRGGQVLVAAKPEGVPEPEFACDGGDEKQNRAEERAGSAHTSGTPFREGDSRPAPDAYGACQSTVRPRGRSKVTRGITEKVVVGCGNLYITVNFDELGICEIFTNTGKNGGCPSQSEAASRLATAAFRSGVDPRYIIKQLRGIRCPSTVRRGGLECASCPDAIARVITRVMREQYDFVPAPRQGGPACPECGDKMASEGGCVVCHNCGYSKCG